MAVSNFEGNSLTYNELNTLSGKLSGLLRTLGVRRGDKVGFILPKSIESFVAIFGILKSGGVYIPIDLKSPIDRIHGIITDAEIQIVITTNECQDKLVLSEKKIEHIVFLDNELLDNTSNIYNIYSLKDILEQDENDIEMTSISSDIAYIIYTSGSTGKPKGVAITHANVVNLINWSSEIFDFNENDRFVSYGPMSFDITVLDIYAPLNVGAALYQFPGDRIILPDEHFNMIKRENITIWNSVPSLLSYIANMHVLKRNCLPSLRKLIFIGEVMPTSVLRSWMKALPQTEFINMFGPTEATFAVSYYKLLIEPESNDEPIPIGKAIPNTELFALTENGKIAGVGDTGELYIRGACVGAGYFRQPDLTEKYFVQNPNSKIPEKVYRTGDIVKLDENQNYIFLGRKDHQVKVKGYRIELGDIEAAIYRCADIKECCVITVKRKQDMPNELVAYIVSNKYNPKILAEDLIDYLPDYMIPKHFFEISQLPRASTGKIDRIELNSKTMEYFSEKSLSK